MQHRLHLTRIGAVQPEIREQHNQVINSSAGPSVIPVALRAEGLLCLASKPVLLLAVAGREVEWDNSRNVCSLCDVTSLARGKMSPMSGNIRICFEECRLNKKLVGTARKRDDSANILQKAIKELTEKHGGELLSLCNRPHHAPVDTERRACSGARGLSAEINN